MNLFHLLIPSFLLFFELLSSLFLSLAFCAIYVLLFLSNHSLPISPNSPILNPLSPTPISSPSHLSSLISQERSCITTSIPCSIYDSHSAPPSFSVTSSSLNLLVIPSVDGSFLFVFFLLTRLRRLVCARIFRWMIHCCHY